MTDTAYDLVPAHLAIQAMRDNGYKNTAYAVAELIDNSIQAGASNVELLCAESEELVNQRTRRRIHEIAVLDNGSGMDKDVLRIALQFGNGTRLEDRSGMGRFGMGLPSASISQCRVVDVWTWQGHPGRALHTQIDIDAVVRRGVRSVPEPTPSPIPEVWQLSASSLSESGTLVVWSKLDRCVWRTARTIVDHSELLIGRMYRKFIDSGRSSIRLATFVKDQPETFNIDRLVKPNDPMYLMKETSTPEPYDTEPMFQQDGDRWEVVQQIEFNGDRHPVHVRFSLAKETVRSTHNAGSTAYGKHAAQNVGISLVRAGRELDLDQSLVNTYDARERWWGIEVEFPPALDEVFGVTNNKQSARHFGEVASNLEKILSGTGGSIAEVKEEMAENEEPTLPLVDLVHLIDRRLKTIRASIKVQAKGQRSNRERHSIGSAEAKGTQVTKALIEEGHVGVSDSDEGSLSPDERQAALKQELMESGVSEQDATSISAHTVDQGIKYTFAAAHLDGRMFFTVKPVAGEIFVKLNSEHAAYRNLVEVLEDEVSSDTSSEELAARLQKANDGLKLLLMAWARYEDEESNPVKRANLQDIRTEWGRYAAYFLEG